MAFRFSFAAPFHVGGFHVGGVSLARPRAALASPPPEPFKSDDAKDDLLTTEQHFFLEQVRRECCRYSKPQLEEKLLEALTLMLRKDTLLKRTVFRWSDHTGE